MKQSNRFRHESLQDRKSVKKLLKAVLNGVENGEITLEDDKGSMTMSLSEMLQLRLTASRDSGENRVTLRMTWQDEDSKPEVKDVSIY